VPADGGRGPDSRLEPRQSRRVAGTVQRFGFGDDASLVALPLVTLTAGSFI
jgi:hypothetical protein